MAMRSKKTGFGGVILHDNHVVWYDRNWVATFTDIDAEKSLDDFRAQDAPSNIPPDILAEPEAAVRQACVERHNLPPPSDD